MKTVVVIPARLQSSRLPNKLLLDLGGKSILRRVYEQCIKAKGINEVYIAIDSDQLKAHCEAFTTNVIVTGNHHQSGTDRIAEAVSNINCDAVINVQGDEPFIDPELISELANKLKENAMVSAMCPLSTLLEVENPNNVKVITNLNQKAIYFSRAVIPYNREGVDFKKMSYYKHLGIYGYTKQFLLNYATMKPTYLEQTEKLEQLRVLEMGYSIQMVITSHNAVGIDTLEDYQNAQKLI